MLHYSCRNCGYEGQLYDWLKAPNPFNYGETLYGCPKCKALETMVFLGADWSDQELEMAKNAQEENQ